MGGLEAPVTHQLMHAHVGGAASAQLELDAAEELRAGKPDSSRGFTEPPARGEAERWRVALTQQDLRWMTTEEITQAFRDGAVKSETFVFRAGMPTWVTLMEVSEIAQALTDARLVSPPLRRLPLEAPEGPASPPQRNSSLPPPRKVARSRAESPLAELLAAADGLAEPEESMPFALVAERSGSKRPVENGSPAAAAAGAESAEVAEPAPELEAAPASPVPEPASSPAVLEPAPVAAPAAPLASTIDLPVVPAPAPPPKSSSTWIWVTLVVLLALGAAALLLGPRFGLRLG